MEVMVSKATVNVVLESLSSLSLKKNKTLSAPRIKL